MRHLVSGALDAIEHALQQAILLFAPSVMPVIVLRGNRHALPLCSLKSATAR
jgi:hypothetical protein